MKTLSHTENQVEFESKVGLELVSSHTREFQGESHFLRVLKWKGSGRKTWRMWSEKNGELQRGTESSGKNLSQETKDWFGL